MKKLLLVLLAICCLFACSCGGGEKPPTGDKQAAGQELTPPPLADTVQALLARAEDFAPGERPYLAASEDEAAGRVGGELIARAYLDFWAAHYAHAATGQSDKGSEISAEDAYQAAWQRVSDDVRDWYLAEKYNLLSAPEDLLEAAQVDWQVLQLDSEAYAEITADLLDNWGLTEEEYWQKFYPRYEAPQLGFFHKLQGIEDDYEPEIEIFDK